MGRGELQACGRRGPTASLRPLRVLFKSYDDYTTNLPLSACLDDDVLLTYKWNGRPLTKDHGGPVRMIIPKRYAWKAHKMDQRKLPLGARREGFREVRGYSNTALPGKTIATDELPPAATTPLVNSDIIQRIEIWPVDIPITDPFVVATGARVTAQNLFMRVTEGTGLTASEAAPFPEVGRRGSSLLLAPPEISRWTDRTLCRRLRSPCRPPD